ncbi:MAG: hypothetical protein IT322_00525 [Anaerolineae bacterium]|nr:hypothetical protein [Anaerolineae bacterium]
MSGKALKIVVVVGLVAVVGLFVVNSTIQAQGPTGNRGPMGMGGFDNSLVATAAEVLKMEPTELITLLQSGQTIADVAKEKGVELETIVDAFVSKHEAFIKVAVEQKRMTQEQADTMLKTLRERVTADLAAPYTGRMGMVRGMGMMGMMGSGMGMMDADGDGYCDLCGMEIGSGRPSGMMGRGGRGMMGR